MNITITIDGQEQQDNVLVESLRIDDHINQQVNQARFTATFRPSVGDEVSIQDGVTKIFAGIILSVELRMRGLKREYNVSCKDWTHYLDRKLVSERYEDMTVTEILTDIIDNYTTGFTLDSVTNSQNVGSIAFNRIPVSECIERLADITNYSWYVDYNKDIHFFRKNTEDAPFNLTEQGGNHVWDSLSITEDISQLRNSIYVIGGEIEGSERTETYAADGEQLEFNLAYKYAAKPTVTVNAVAQTVGTDNVSDEDDFDCFWSFQEKYIRFKVDTQPAAADDVEISGTPLFPIIVNVPSNLSINEFGEYEFKIKDTSIRTRAEAIDRAKAEIKAYAASVKEGSFTTYRSGLVSGQTITVTAADIEDEFLIQRVQLRMRTRQDGEWSVTLATLKTIGIITFLQSLLRDDEITQDEAVTLLNLISGDESVGATDSMTIPSRTVTSPPYVYGPSAGNAGKWNFSTWT